MGRQRNNIMKLSAETRHRIFLMLDDGATYDEIREDKNISEECAEREILIHNSSILAYSKSDEYREYRNLNKQYRAEIERSRIARIFVDSEDAADNIAKFADYQLLRICQQKLDEGEDLDPKELSAISRAVSSYNRNRLASDKEDTKREAAEREADYQGKIAALEAQIEKLTGSSKKVDSEKVADELNRILGVK